MFPVKLYRGDKRNSKRTERINEGLLFTNLLDKGIGQDIIKNSLTSLIQSHIHPGWTKTHFLSFSENIDTAMSYGMGQLSGIPCETSEEGKGDFVIIQFDSLNLHSYSLISKGVFKCLFVPQRFVYKPYYQILLINTYDHLIDQIKGIDNIYLAKAKQDYEWLILPLQPITLQPNNQTEFSAQLDMGGVFTCQAFEML